MVFCNLGRPAPRQLALPTRLADAPRHRNALARGLGNDFFK